MEGKKEVETSAYISFKPTEVNEKILETIKDVMKTIVDFFKGGKTNED